MNNHRLLGYDAGLDVFDPAGTRHRAGAVDPGLELATELLAPPAAAGAAGALGPGLRRALARRLPPARVEALVRALQPLAAQVLTGHDAAPGRQARAAARASRLFGIELEGLSAEDQAFETARRLAALALDAARHAATAPAQAPAAAVARWALARAARRGAPGWRPDAGDARPSTFRSAGITARRIGATSFPQGAHHA